MKLPELSAGNVPNNPSQMKKPESIYKAAAGCLPICLNPIQSWCKTGRSGSRRCRRLSRAGRLSSLTQDLGRSLHLPRACQGIGEEKRSGQPRKALPGRDGTGREGLRHESLGGLHRRFLPSQRRRSSAG